MISKNKTLTVFDILMINIVSIVSLKNVSITSQYGLSIVLIYFVVTVIFLIPGAIAVSELSTKFLQSGGISIWINKAFGSTVSSYVISMQWIYNIIFFPTITVFATTQLSYFISHVVGIDTVFFTSSKIYVTVSALLIFWLGVFINSRGITISSMLSNISAIFGIFLPILLIILLSLGWLLSGHEIELTMQYLPSNDDNLSLVIIVFFSLVGIEVAAAHADRVKDPKRTFPKAIYLSVLIAPILLIFVNLAIAVVLPSYLIDDRSGLIETFSIFFEKFNLSYMTPAMALVLTIGSFGCLSSWMLTLSKYLLKIAEYNNLPEIFTVTNKNDVPMNILIMQGIIYSALCLSYLWMPSIEETYLFLSSLSAQIALLANAIFFIAAIKLRLNYEWDEAYQFTKNKYLSIAMFVLGAVGCFLGIVLGFFVVDSSVYLDSINYIVIGGVIIVVLPKLFVRLFKLKRY